MYSQNPTHFNTVFLITLFAGFLPCQGVNTGAEYSTPMRCGG
jgi:hypothetical protein